MWLLFMLLRDPFPCDAVSWVRNSIHQCYLSFFCHTTCYCVENAKYINIIWVKTGKILIQGNFKVPWDRLDIFSALSIETDGGLKSLIDTESDMKEWKRTKIRHSVLLVGLLEYLSLNVRAGRRVKIQAQWGVEAGRNEF